MNLICNKNRVFFLLLLKKIRFSYMQHKYYVIDELKSNNKIWIFQLKNIDEDMINIFFLIYRKISMLELRIHTGKNLLDLLIIKMCSFLFSQKF